MSTIFPKIFLHFYDIHFLQQKGFKYSRNEITYECRLATRIAIIYSDVVIIPAASYIESAICREIVNENKDLFTLGIFEIAGNANHLSHFCDKKLSEYPVGSIQHSLYKKTEREDITPPFRNRTRSATSDIAQHWLFSLESTQIISHISRTSEISLPKNFENAWASVPEKLEEKAFIVAHVQKFLGKISKNPSIENIIHTIINQAYFSSYTRDLGAGIITDMVYLNPGYEIETYGPSISYKKVIQILLKRDMLNQLLTSTPIDLLKKRTDPQWISVLHQSIEDYIIDATTQQKYIYLTKKGEICSMQTLRSFIVHGHDKVLMYELKDFLQSVLKMPEPIILNQQRTGGKTIIEKFENFSNQIDVAFVIMSPDDEIIKSEGTINKRARQNVIFELGYFMGIFGRRSGRVILLYKNPLEIPSDLDGVIYIDVSNGIEKAGEEIRRELGGLSSIG